MGIKRDNAQDCRQYLMQAERVVVKIGTRLLAGASGRPEPGRIKQLVQGISQLMQSGKEVVLVSSGAVGMGLDALGKKTRPESLPDLQMAAAVGQTRLMSYYESLFAAEGIQVGQILLTHDDLNDRRRHLNARNTVLSLLRHGIIPVVNENDAVSTDEITVGDNDLLGSLVAVLIDADALVILTTVNGLRKRTESGRSVRVPYLERVTKSALGLAEGKGSALSRGGMNTKLQAVQQVAKAGGLALIADGRKPAVLSDIFSGKDEGTLVGGLNRIDKVRHSRKRWIAFFHHAQGTLVVDDGARDALELRGRSLLPIGIKHVRGQFPPGALVNVEGLGGQAIARGLVSYSSSQLQKIKRKKTTEIASVLGRKDFDEAIHRDNMVVLRNHTEEIS